MERDRLLSGGAIWEGKTWDEGKWTETRKVGGIERKKIKDNIQAELKKDISTWVVAFPYTLKVHICKLEDPDTNSYILPPCTTITHIHNCLIFLIMYKLCVHEHINSHKTHTHTHPSPCIFPLIQKSIDSISAKLSETNVEMKHTNMSKTDIGTETGRPNQMPTERSAWPTPDSLKQLVIFLHFFK